MARSRTAPDSNLDLSIGFKGQLKLNAEAVPLQEGYLKLGGFVDPNATKGLEFGKVVSVDPDEPDTFIAGTASGQVVRGVAVFDDAIAQNAPGHPNSYLPGLPCAALNHGFMWLGSWEKDATGAIDPAIGCVVIFKDTTGDIEFIASGAAPTGYTILAGASVRDVDADKGALIYLN